MSKEAHFYVQSPLLDQEPNMQIEYRCTSGWELALRPNAKYPMEFPSELLGMYQLTMDMYQL